jgi:hypothetical protein
VAILAAEAGLNRSGDLDSRGGQLAAITALETMEPEVSEIIILVIVCIVWTCIATPEFFKAMREIDTGGKWFKSELEKMHWTTEPAEGMDPVMTARFARCGCYAICSCVPLGTYIIFPYSLAVGVFLFLLVFGLSWYFLVKRGA